MPVFGPNVEAASDPAVRANRFRPPYARIPHGGLYFGYFQYRRITRLGFETFDHIDHAVKHGLAEAGHESGMPEHGFLHQGVARTNCDAVSAGNATRLADRRAAIPQDTRMRVFPAN